MFRKKEFEGPIPVIEKNLLKMRTSMMPFLTAESFGGNTGEVEIAGRKYPCAAVNGYIDINTGEIIEFTTSTKKIEGAIHFALKIAVAFSGPPFMKIVTADFSGSPVMR